MTLEDTKLMVMRYCRNFFNEDNSASGIPGPPPDFIALCEEIHAFQERDGNSNVVSESVLGGKHSYTFGTNGQGGRARWNNVFKDMLSAYRKHTFNP